MKPIHIKYLGQCGFLISSDTIKIAIDPVLTDLFDDDGNDIRLYPPVISPKDLDVDFIFCTHDHIDHMAIDTITQCLSCHPNTKIILPLGCAHLLKDAGLLDAQFVYLSEQEEKCVVKETLSVKGISAAHPIHQKDTQGLDRNLVYSILLDDYHIVHLGDTYLTDQLQQDLMSLSPIDVFFPPINGRDEERDKKGIIGNLNYEEAAKLACDLQVKLAIPTHFDMVVGNTENPQYFAKEFTKQDNHGMYWIPVFEKEYIYQK